MDIQTFQPDVRRNHADRYLVVVTLAEVSEKLGEPVRVVYTNNMNPGAIAGNHYHKHKRECFRSAHGRMEVHLVDINTQERRVVVLDADPESSDHLCLIVPAGVAHAVRNIGADIARLDVYATDEPRKPSDDFAFPVLKAAEGPSEG